MHAYYVYFLYYEYSRHFVLYDVYFHRFELYGFDEVGEVYVLYLVVRLAQPLDVDDVYLVLYVSCVVGGLRHFD